MKTRAATLIGNTSFLCLARSPLLQSVFCFVIFLSVQAEDRIRIGVSVPLTGTGAAYGTDIKNALLFANENIGHSAYDLIIEDDQCSDREAVTIAHKFVSVDRINYALGFGCSGTVLASAPIYEKAKVVVIASGTGAPAITNAGDYIFRTKPSLTLAADLLAKEFFDRHYDKVAAITEETAFCQGLTNAIQEKVKLLKVELLNENFIPGTEDFQVILFKLKAAGAKAIFFNPQGEAGLVTLVKQLRRIGWDIPVYGTFSPGSPTFLSAVGKDAEGIIYADLQLNNQMLNSSGQRLYAEFEKKYGKALSAEHYSALTLVAYSVLDEAIKKGNDVQTNLYQSTFKNLVDDLSFDKNGDVVSSKVTYVLKLIQNGVPVIYPKIGKS